MRARYGASSLPCAVGVWGLFSLVIGAQAACGQDQGSDPLTLSRAVEVALESNPLIKAADAGIEGAAAQTKEARASRLPGLQLGETVTHSTNPVAAFGAKLEQGSFGPQDLSIQSMNDPDPVTNFRTTLSMQVPLLAAREISAHTRQAVLSEERARIQREGVLQQIRFEVIRAYDRVRVARFGLEVAEASVAMAEAELKRMEDLFETGSVVQSDLLSMRVQHADFLQKQIQARGELTMAYAGLSAAVGQTVTDPPGIVPEFEDLAVEELDSRALIERALTDRPEMQQALLDQEIAREGLRRARGGYGPRWSLFGSAGDSAEDLDDRSSDWTIGTTVSLDLLEPGRAARIQGAQAAMEVSSAQREHLADAIQVEVIQALEGLRAAQERLGVASQAVARAEEALRIVRDRYGVGLTTVTEVLRSQTALVQTQLNLFAAQYDREVGYAATLLAHGALKDVDAFAR